jgi:hypothetical protein
MALDRQLQLREAEEAREAHFLQASAGIDRATALRRWRRRCRATLLATLQWPDAEQRREREVENCVALLQTIARHLYQRGWLLQEERLGQLVKDFLRPIAAAQAAGQVRDLYPYFRAAVSRYVPVNADEIRMVAKRSGADIASTMDVLVSGLGLRAAPPPSMTEVVAERSPRRP